MTSVAGRVNQIKMAWLPQLLYGLHNAPIWLPSKIFEKINSLFIDLIWKGRCPRIKLKVLQVPRDGGGLAVPNSSQAQNFTGWGELKKLAQNSLDTLLEVFIPYNNSLPFC